MFQLKIMHLIMLIHILIILKVMNQLHMILITIIMDLLVMGH